MKRWNKEKIRENIEAELIAVILQESLKNKKVYEIDTTNKKPKEVVEIIKKILRGINKYHLPGKVNWMKF